MHTEQLAAPPPLGPRYLTALLPRRRGDRLPDRELEVPELRADLDRLADYARLCGFPLDGLLPTSYPQLLAFPLQVQLMTAPDFPLPLPGLVHLRQRIDQYRSLDACAPLGLRVHAERLRAHAKGAQVDLVTEVTVSGKRAWRGRATYLARGARAPTANGDSGGSGAGDRFAEGEPAEMTTGHLSARWHIGANIGRRYAAVSGDVNPIHLHRLPARLFGFPGAIAHGMWTAARCLATVHSRLTEAHSVDVVFRKPVVLPTTVELVTAALPGGWDLTLRRAHRSEVHLVAAVRAEPRPAC
jgi:acyl dehydratase